MTSSILLAIVDVHSSNCVAAVKARIAYKFTLWFFLRAYHGIWSQLIRPQLISTAYSRNHGRWNVTKENKT
jgi:hypothetical protein